MTRTLRAGLLSAALGMLLNANVASAKPIELKLAYFVGDQHAMSADQGAARQARLLETF